MGGCKRAKGMKSRNSSKYKWDHEGDYEPQELPQDVTCARGMIARVGEKY